MSSILSRRTKLKVTDAFGGQSMHPFGGNSVAAVEPAVIFMVQWAKKRGIEKEKVLDLGVWSKDEAKEIERIYRYKFT